MTQSDGQQAQAAPTVVSVAAVDVQRRPDGSQPWSTVRSGLVTGADGRVGVQVKRTRAAWYRFVTAAPDFAVTGGSGSGSGSRVSDDVLVKGQPKLSAGWKGGRKTVVGRVLRLDGTPVARVEVTLQRRYAGSSRWVAVTTRPSTSEGRVSVRQRPRRTAYFRWVYRGGRYLLPARSASVRGAVRHRHSRVMTSPVPMQRSGSMPRTLRVVWSGVPTRPTSRCAAAGPTGAPEPAK